MGEERTVRRSGMTDMTVGSPARLILFFAIPLLIGNALQQLYNMVDSIVVGNFVGDQALAAVGTGFPIIFMMISLFRGMSVGATVMISQYYGARELEKVQETVSTIYTALMLASLPLMLLGIFLSGPLLKIMRVPDDGTLQMAQTYMMVIFAGVTATIGYNVNAGILQGLGDSKTTLLFLAVATVINIVLDLAFTVVFHLGVLGVALATIIAQFCSWIFGIFFINRRYDCVRIQLFRLRFNGDIFKQAMKLGVPSGLQQMVFSIGMMVMQSLVNSYGSLFMAGFNGANKIDTFAFMPIESFTLAISTCTGQNVGANDYDRVHQGTLAGMKISVAVSILVAVFLYPTGGWMMQMFSQSPEVIQAGEAYLHCVLPGYFLLAISFVLNSVMRGAGEAIVPMVSSVLAFWFVRVPAAYWIAAVWGKDFIFVSYPIGWAVGILISGLYYRTGRWKSKGIASRSPQD